MSEEAPPMPADHKPASRKFSTWGPAFVLAALFFLVLLTSGSNLYLTLTRTSSACDFYRDLSGLPVTTSQQTGKPSELGVGIIAHSRQAWRGSGCSGHLPPPSASFKKWAPYFHLSPE